MFFLYLLMKGIGAVTAMEVLHEFKKDKAKDTLKFFKYLFYITFFFKSLFKFLKTFKNARTTGSFKFSRSSGMK